MSNGLRFLLGIFAAISIIFIGAFVLLLLSPFIFIGSGVMLFLLGAGSVIFSLAFVFALIYYMTRKEPERKESNDYSIDEGKNV